ncbi:MAG: UPF0175 family protein [Anaerolineales bacterium]|nr:UPF0175 family protein [Anaerolineales bacterium]
MSIFLEIPDAITQAMRLPEHNQEQALLVELAVSLYAQGVLSFGKARELAQLDHYQFGQMLGQRGISRHYTTEELTDDLNYAHRQ